MIDLSFVLPICFLPDAKNAYQVRGNFRFDSCLRRIRDTNNFDRFLKVFLHYNGTSHLRHIHSEDMVPENVLIIFVFFTSIEGTPLFRGKGQSFWVQNTDILWHSKGD